MINAAILVALLASSLSHPQGSPLERVRFSPGTYDFYGYVKWGELGSIKPECRRVLDLMQTNRFAEADKALRKVREKDPFDLTAIQGLVICEWKLKRLPQLMNEIAIEARRGKDVTAPSPPHLVLFYQYALGVMSEAVEQGESMAGFNPANARTPAGFYYSSLYTDARAFMPDDKLASLLYVSQLLSRRLIAEARHAAERVLKSNPRYYQMRLLYSESLDQGTIARMRGNGGWSHDIPDDEKGWPKRAYAEAKQVVADAPTWLPGYYSAGCQAFYLDKAAARRYLTYYIDHAERGTVRYRWAVKRLSEL